MNNEKDIKDKIVALKNANSSILDQINDLEIKIDAEFRYFNSINEENTISFQLGLLIISSLKSVPLFFKLPINLFKLWKENNRRKRSKKVNNVQVSLNKTETERDQSGYIEFKQGLTLLDPISELCWNDAFIGYGLVRSDFIQQIINSKSDFAFFESAWNANKGTWIYAFTSPNLKHANAQSLLEAITALKKKGIPIIFWNKEDPMHYEMFKPIASLVDYVFTTDELMVDKYRKELKHNNVWALPFAAPVKKINPIGRFSTPSETVCFAGTYYASNHPDRKRQMDMLLPTLLDNNGVIYDRASKDISDKYNFPTIYKNIIRDGVDFEAMTILYKKFKVFLNVNTITQSTTMMSRRVYELLASGTPVISTPSKAITEQFPGIVLTVRNEQEAKLAVNKLLNDSYFWHKQSVLGIRAVLSQHSYEDRWDYIKNSINAAEGLRSVKEKVRVIALYHGYQDISKFLDSLFSQKGVDVSEVIILKSSKLNVSVDNDNVKFVNISNFKIKDHVNANKEIDYTFITQDSVYNFKNSILGMIVSFKYSGTNAIARKNYFKYSKLIKNYCFSIDTPNWYSRIQSIDMGSLLVRDSKIDEFNVDFVNKKVSSKNKDILLIDPFNLLHIDDRLAPLEKVEGLIYKSVTKLGI